MSSAEDAGRTSPGRDPERQGEATEVRRLWGEAPAGAEGPGLQEGECHGRGGRRVTWSRFEGRAAGRVGRAAGPGSPPGTNLVLGCLDSSPYGDRFACGRAPAGLSGTLFCLETL